MGWKPLLAIDSAPDAEANLIPSGTGTFEHFVRRFAGDGPINLLKAKGEVHAALRSGGVVPASPSIDDALRAEQIPSVGAGDREDRVLAEIDQDGFAFAADALDESFFNRRLRRKPRQMNLIDIVLIEGHVCIRKRIRELRLGARRWGNRPVPAKEWAYRGLWASLGLYFYSEAAALLRMSDLPFVPKLRCIDFADRALYLDYVP